METATVPSIRYAYDNDSTFSHNTRVHAVTSIFNHCFIIIIVFLALFQVFVFYRSHANRKPWLYFGPYTIHFRLKYASNRKHFKKNTCSRTDPRVPILKRTRLLCDFKKVLVFKCKTVRQSILFGFAVLRWIRESETVSMRGKRGQNARARAFGSPPNPLVPRARAIYFVCVSGCVLEYIQCAQVYLRAILKYYSFIFKNPRKIHTVYCYSTVDNRPERTDIAFLRRIIVYTRHSACYWIQLKRQLILFVSSFKMSPSIMFFDLSAPKRLSAEIKIISNTLTHKITYLRRHQSTASPNNRNAGKKWNRKNKYYFISKTL